MEPTKGDPSPQECFRTLLRGRGLYDDPGHVNLAPYQSDAVSLPSQLRDAPMLEDLVDDECRFSWRGMKSV